jgi:hypothetical protein
MRPHKNKICSLGVLVACSTAPAQTRPAPDFSTPEKTWASVCEAVRGEDLAGFRSCFHNATEISKLFMDAYSDTTVTTFSLAHATARLGEQGKQLGQRLESVYTDLVESGKGRVTKIDRENATWSRTVTDARGGKHVEVMYFRKVEGKWLIDTEQSYGLGGAEGRKSAEDFIAQSKQQLPALKGIVGDVREGTIQSVAELRTRMAALPQ